MTDNAKRMLFEVKKYKDETGQFIPISLLEEKLKISGAEFKRTRKELEELGLISRNHAKYDLPKEEQPKTAQEKAKDIVSKIEKGEFDFIPILQILGLIVYLCITVINSYLSFIYFNESLNIFISSVFAYSFVLFASMSFIAKFISTSRVMGNIYLVVFMLMVIVNTFFAVAGQINGYYDKQSNTKSVEITNNEVQESIKRSIESNKKQLIIIEKQLTDIDVSDKKLTNKLERLKREQLAIISKINQDEDNLRTELKTDNIETRKGKMNIYKILAGQFTESKEGIIRLAIYIFPCLLLEVISALSLYFALFIRREKGK